MRFGRVLLSWLLLALAVHQSAALIEDVIEVFGLAKEIGEGIFKNWKLLTGMDDFVMPKEKRLMNKLAGINREIDKVDRAVHSSSSETISAVVRSLRHSQRLDLRMQELIDIVQRVDAAAEYMEHYMEDGVEKETKVDFAQNVVSHSSMSIRGLIDALNSLVVGDTSRGRNLLDKGLLNMLVEALETSEDYMCSLQQSPQQMLYNMYNTIAITEMKGYSMMQFSWMLLKIYNKGNFTLEGERLRDKFQERSVQTLTALKDAMSKASRVVWRCDPPHHEEGVTFEALTRLLQGYVENEVDMNSEGTCGETCAFYQHTKNYGCFKDQFCSRQPKCEGKIVKCNYVDSDMWICPANRYSSRRYEWVEYESGQVLGKKGYCARGTTKVDSWWRYLFWHCSYCMCLCDQAGPLSDRYFSLREAVANAKTNKVVTGVRFVKKNRVIHLQINTGTLQEYGKIDKDSVRWNAVPEIDVRSPQMADGIDYHQLTYEKRAIDLDDLNGPPDHVLTGVRLRMVGSHLNFEIRTTQFNFTTGKLISPELSMWRSNDNTDADEVKPRTKVTTDNLDVPTRSTVSSAPISKNDQYLEFTHTGFNVDAAQTTVPFLDTQDVKPGLVVPLSGAGLFYKGTPLYGGYVAPKVMTYDYTRHMHVKELVLNDIPVV